MYCERSNNSYIVSSNTRLRPQLPAFVATQFYSISSHEAVQLAQDATKGKMHFYEHTDPRKNMAAYGQLEAPIYNLTRIRSRSISLWRGGKDSLATPTDVEILKRDLSGRSSHNCSVDRARRHACQPLTSVPFHPDCVALSVRR